MGVDSLLFCSSYLPRNSWIYPGFWGELFVFLKNPAYLWDAKICLQNTNRVFFRYIFSLNRSKNTTPRLECISLDWNVFHLPGGREDTPQSHLHLRGDKWSIIRQSQLFSAFHNLRKVHLSISLWFLWFLFYSLCFFLELKPYKWLPYKQIFLFRFGHFIS